MRALAAPPPAVINTYKPLKLNLIFAQVAASRPRISPLQLVAVAQSVSLVLRPPHASPLMTGKTKILEWAKGFRGRAKNCIAIARERVEKGLQYAYRDRRTLKRDMRSLWIQRINAGAREHGVRSPLRCSPAYCRPRRAREGRRGARRLPARTTAVSPPGARPQLKYSQLMYGLTAENIVINRKALSELAQNEPQSFKARARARGARRHAASDSSAPPGPGRDCTQKTGGAGGGAAPAHSARPDRATT